MSKVYGAELAEQIKEDIQRSRDAIERRIERINRWETDWDDCFLSQRVEETSISEGRMKLEILSGDGFMEIETLVDEHGKEIPSRWVNTRYGAKLVSGGVFANSLKALAKKRGLRVVTIKVPCWVKRMSGSGGGLCAAYGSYPAVVRWPVNMVTGQYFGYPED